MALERHNYGAEDDKKNGAETLGDIQGQSDVVAMAAETPLEKTRNAVQARGVTSCDLSIRSPPKKRLACLL